MFKNLFKHEICLNLTIKPPEQNRKNKSMTVNICSKSATLTTDLGYIFFLLCKNYLHDFGIKQVIYDYNNNNGK